MSNSSSPAKKPLKHNIDWYAMACKIRTQNEKLKDKIVNLETLIDEQKEQIKVQVVKNQDCEQVIKQQAETQEILDIEIEKYQAQIEQKEERIATQQDTINQLIQELEKIQQQTARLERECSLLQDNYQEEQNKLQQMETENKDLRIRLQRQQRYNLQYKTALDQFLDTSSTSPNRENNSLGIKSWSDVQENDNGNGNHSTANDYDSIEVWGNSSETENTTKTEPESLTTEDKAEEKPLPSQNESTKKTENQESREKQAEEKKSRGKLFIKLPQFGLKNKNEKS